jgi:hypothetical protein
MILCGYSNDCWPDYSGVDLLIFGKYRYSLLLTINLKYSGLVFEAVIFRLTVVMSLLIRNDGWYYFVLCRMHLLFCLLNLLKVMIRLLNYCLFVLFDDDIMMTGIIDIDDDCLFDICWYIYWYIILLPFRLMLTHCRYYSVLMTPDDDLHSIDVIISVRYFSDPIPDGMCGIYLAGITSC